MPARWTTAEEEHYRNELRQLYVEKNKTIGEIAKSLDLTETTVYDRLMRLGIPSLRLKKPKCNNRRNDITIPTEHSPELAEFVGILLGDGHISATQVMVTLGLKDVYVSHVARLIKKVFGVTSKVTVSKSGHKTVYFGSTAAVRWLRQMGLVSHKVREQVCIPAWIAKDKRFMQAALRGLFDTDGSVYKLRYGMQISFCNHSRPLIEGVRNFLITLGFSPSKISGYNLYLTKRVDIVKFFREVGFKNKKHIVRFRRFVHDGRVA